MKTAAELLAQMKADSDWDAPLTDESRAANLQRSSTRRFAWLSNRAEDAVVSGMLTAIDLRKRYGLTVAEIEHLPAAETHHCGAQLLSGRQSERESRVNFYAPWEPSFQKALHGLRPTGAF